MTNPNALRTVAELDDGRAPVHDDVQGWHSEDEVFKNLLEEHPPNIIVEVGSWKGASIITMLRACDARAYCVDTWLGSRESYRKTFLNGTDLLKERGYPRVYDVFFSNIKNAGLAARVTPVPLPSSIAAAVLEDLGVKPDFVYLDASHEYADVKRDLAAYSKLLAPGGVLLGDDYNRQAWPGLCRAVDEWNDGTIEFVKNKEFYVWKKPQEDQSS